MKYIKTTCKEGRGNLPIIYFYEIDENKFNTRLVTHYKNGQIKVADLNGGYLGEVIAEGPLWNSTIDEINNPPEVISVEISSDDFEKEWVKATSQKGFKLKHYIELN